MSGRVGDGDSLRFDLAAPPRLRFFIRDETDSFFARDRGQTIFVGGWGLGQLWLFWVAPLVGGLLGGSLYRGLFTNPDQVAVPRRLGRTVPALPRTTWVKALAFNGGSGPM